MNEKEERVIFKEPASLNVIHDLMVFNSMDHSTNKKDITMYGIVVGWDNDSYRDFMYKDKLTIQQIERIRLLHNQFCRIRLKNQ